MNDFAKENIKTIADQKKRIEALVMLKEFSDSKVVTIWEECVKLEKSESNLKKELHSAKHWKIVAMVMLVAFAALVSVAFVIWSSITFKIDVPMAVTVSFTLLLAFIAFCIHTCNKSLK